MRTAASYLTCTRLQDLRLIRSHHLMWHQASSIEILGASRSFINNILISALEWRITLWTYSLRSTISTHYGKLLSRHTYRMCDKYSIFHRRFLSLKQLLLYSATLVTYDFTHERYNSYPFYYKVWVNDAFQVNRWTRRLSSITHHATKHAASGCRKFIKLSRGFRSLTD